MKQITCSSWQNFIQHYTYVHNRFFRIHCGHCICKRLKIKKPDAAACENYVQAAPEENEFVTKEYLSKKMLDYFMRMELLPEICEE